MRPAVATFSVLSGESTRARKTINTTTSPTTTVQVARAQRIRRARPQLMKAPTAAKVNVIAIRAIQRSRSQGSARRMPSGSAAWRSIADTGIPKITKTRAPGTIPTRPASHKADSSGKCARRTCSSLVSERRASAFEFVFREASNTDRESWSTPAKGSCW